MWCRSRFAFTGCVVQIASVLLLILRPPPLAQNLLASERLLRHHALISRCNTAHGAVQLLMVLPPASHQHLPAALQPLMLSASSPIKDFFPTDFETDGEGTRAEYEAVVLLPFVNKQRLVAAFDSVPKESFKQGELVRNAVGEIHVFERLEGSKEVDFCSTTLPAYASDVGAPESRCARRPPVPVLAPGQPGFQPEIANVRLSRDTFVIVV
jgi:Xrn1 helical domain